MMNFTVSLARPLLARGLALALAGAMWISLRADAVATNGWPHFQEILHVLRNELQGVEEGKLNQALVEGLLRQLHPRVLMDARTGSASSLGARLSRKELIDGKSGLLRIAEVAEGLEREFAAAVDSWKTNKLDGLIVDLRFAGGSDYGVAARVAAQFLESETELLDFGQGMLKGGSGTNYIAYPTVVLVNRYTAGAAEALAALLRKHCGSVLLGGSTANLAKVYKQVALSNGRRIEIATGSLAVPEIEGLSESGVTPDIILEVPLELEKRLFESPYAKEPAKRDSARRPGVEPRARLNEAELVRRQREGLDPEETVAPEFREAASPSPKPALTDPALARAADLLKGIANFRKTP